MIASLLTVINWLLPLLYLALLVGYGAAFFLRTKAHARNPWLPPVIAVHILFLVLRAIRLGYPPLVTSHEVLSVLALSTAVVYSVVEFAGRDRRTGMFVFLLVFLFQYTSSVFLMHTVGAPAAPQSGAQFSWASLHVVPAVMAYVGVTIAAVYGLLHLMARRGLKQHSFGVLFGRLPSLDLLGKMSWYALVFGFVFMTVTIATSPIILREVGAAGQTSIWDPKVSTKIVTGSAAWLIYMVAVLGRLVAKWPVSKVCWFAVNGFLVVAILLTVSVILS